MPFTYLFRLAIVRLKLIKARAYCWQIYFSISTFGDIRLSRTVTVYRHYECSAKILRVNWTSIKYNQNLPHFSRC